MEMSDSSSSTSKKKLKTLDDEIKAAKERVAVSESDYRRALEEYRDIHSELNAVENMLKNEQDGEDLLDTLYVDEGLDVSLLPEHTQRMIRKWKRLHMKHVELKEQKNQAFENKAQASDELKRLQEQSMSMVQKPDTSRMAFFEDSDDTMGLFLRRVLDFTEQEIDGMMIWTFGDPIFGIEKLGHRLLIRPCYKDLCDLIVGDPNLFATVLTGNPGIGKTCFAIYLIVYLLRHKSTTIIYQRETSYFALKNLPGHGGLIVEEVDPFKAGGLVRTKENWFISDPLRQEPISSTCRTVVITSPDRRKYKQFQKQSCKKFVMPLPTDDEMLVFHKVLCPDATRDEIQGRIRVCGNELRRVFHMRDVVSLEELQFGVDGACSAMANDFISVMNSAGEYFSASGGDTEGGNISFKVLSLTCGVKSGNVSYHFWDARLMWSSTYVLESFVQRHYDRIYKTAARELHDFQGLRDGHEAIRGNIFESFAHVVLCKGGQFTTRRLNEPRSICKFEMPYMPYETFDNINKAREAGVYYRPRSKTFASVDSFVVVDQVLFMFQITIADSHPVKYNGLLTIIEHAVTHLGAVEFNLFFVGPAAGNWYDAFKEQNYITTNNTKYKGGMNTKVKMTNQYALAISLVEK